MDTFWLLVGQRAGWLMTIFLELLFVLLIFGFRRGSY
jgi:hypothetical protein